MALKNIIENSKAAFLKVRNGEELSDDDRLKLVNFYLEVIAQEDN